LEVYGYTGKTLVNTEERSANELNHIRATIENPTCKRCIIIQQAQSPESHPVYIPYPGHIARRRTPSTITGEYNWYHSRNEEGMYRYGSDQTPASEDEYPEPMEIYGSNLAPVLWFGINLYLAAREDDERREPLRRNTDRENVVNVGQHGPRPL
jgi:hypothetical protein